MNSDLGVECLLLCRPTYLFFNYYYCEFFFFIIEIYKLYECQSYCTYCKFTELSFFYFSLFVDRLVVIENGWLFCILGNIWNNKERICSSIINFSLEFVYNPIKMISMVPDI